MKINDKKGNRQPNNQKESQDLKTSNTQNQQKKSRFVAKTKTNNDLVSLLSDLVKS